MEINAIDYTTFFSTLDPAGNLSDTLKNKLLSNMKVLPVKAKSHLLRPEKICKDIYFIVEGFITSYELVNEMRDTISIFQNNDFIIGLPGLSKSRTARIGLICLKNAVVLSMNFHAWRNICEEEPHIADLFNTYNTIQLIEERQKNRLLTKGKTGDRLQAHKDLYPGLMGLVTQKFLSDLLGVKEQTINKALPRLK